MEQRNNSSRSCRWCTEKMRLKLKFEGEGLDGVVPSSDNCERGEERASWLMFKGCGWNEELEIRCEEHRVDIWVVDWIVDV
jgi:hypothetical protein